jgi:hypothetical protein
MCNVTFSVAVYHYPEAWRCLVAVLAPFLIAGYGLHKKSLSASGAVAGLNILPFECLMTEYLNKAMGQSLN